MMRWKNVTKLSGGSNLFPRIDNIQDLLMFNKKQNSDNPQRRGGVGRDQWPNVYKCWETELFRNVFIIVRPFNIED